MDEDIQREITRVCIALLQKSAAGDHSASQYCAVCSPGNEAMGQCNAPQTPKTKKDALAFLLKAASEPDITFGDVMDALEVIYYKSKPASQTRQWVIQLLCELMAREDIIASDAISAATELYVVSPRDSQERQEAIEYLLALAKRRDIPFNDIVEAAHSLYLQSPRGSKEEQQAVEMLLEQARWPDTTAAQAQEAALALCFATPLYRSKVRSQSIQALIEVYQRPNPSFEDAVVLDYFGIGDPLVDLNSFGSIVAGTKTLEKRQRTVKKQMWAAVAQRPDLTAEQRTQVETILGYYV